jgi:hypothetical protein
MTEINLPKMKKNLIVLYEAFLKNPDDKKVQYIVKEYDKEYGGLPSYEELSIKKIIPDEIINAINGLSTLYQYGRWDESHEAFSKRKILETAQKILKELKKN